MTEKRFTMYRNTIYDNGNILSSFNCMKVMNTLHNENEQLKHDATVLIQANQEYRRENEEFKKALVELKEIGDYQYGRIKELDKENEQLKELIKKSVVERLLDNFEYNCKELAKENEELKTQLTDCKEKKQEMKEFFMNSEAIIEQKKLQKLIYKRVFNLIDEKIDEFKNGDYGDLPCNTIHMFLDLKQELGDFE